MELEYCARFLIIKDKKITYSQNLDGQNDQKWRRAVPTFGPPIAASNIFITKTVLNRVLGGETSTLHRQLVADGLYRWQVQARLTEPSGFPLRQ